MEQFDGAVCMGSNPMGPSAFAGLWAQQYHWFNKTTTTTTVAIATATTTPTTAETIKDALQRWE